MAGIIEKKGKILGTGTPLICVPVTEETQEKIVEEIRILTEQNVDMIEWRMDWFSEVTDKEAVKSVLEEIRPYVENTLFLLTFRSKDAGWTATDETGRGLRTERSGGKDRSGRFCRY